MKKKNREKPMLIILVWMTGFKFAVSKKTTHFTNKLGSLRNLRENIYAHAAKNGLGPIKLHLN